MAIAPLTYLERKWASGRAAANRIIDAATQSQDRKQIPLNDYDFHRNISTFGRRTLVTLGRWLFWNSDPVRGAVLEAANYATETWVAQFEGANQEWGQEAEQWLREHNKFCNVRGGNKTFETFLFNLVISHFTDGELFTVLTEIDGVPKLQVFPSHRVGSRTQQTSVTDEGPFKGMPMIDGVVVNEYAGPVGFQIFSDDMGYGASPSQIVSANDVIATFVPYCDEQLRGISLLGASMFNWSDAREFRAFQMLSEKLHASVGLIVQNETGEIDTAKRVVGAPSSGLDTGGNATATATEKIDGISVNYFKSGTGQTIEALRSDTPTANQQEFTDSAIREAMAGIGWSWDFSLNPTKAGGAQMRVIVDKVNSNLEALRKFIVRPTCSRIDGWRISKAIKVGWLKPTTDWYDWSYQGPAELTADKKYASDVDLQEQQAGVTTMQRSTSRRGEYWRDVREQQSLEVDDRLTRAKAASDKFGISIELALSQFGVSTPNGNMPPADTGTDAPATEAA